MKYAQPGYRHRAPAAPPTAEQRAARLSPSQVLEKITRTRIQRDEADAELAALIDHAVTLGISWPDIARHLGVTRQAARPAAPAPPPGRPRGPRRLTGVKHQPELRQRMLPGPEETTSASIMHRDQREHAKTTATTTGVARKL